MQDANGRFDDDDELLTTDGSAEFLGLSKSFLAKARRKGTGPPFIEIGDRLIKYKKSSLRKWRDERQFLQSRRKRRMISDTPLYIEKR
jgi:predicted DNA-binding transcriptional regulator AlpA